MPPPDFLETMPASFDGNTLELIQPLTVMLPVNFKVSGLPRLIEPLMPSNWIALPYLPVTHVAPPASDPVIAFPDASAVERPFPSAKAYAAIGPVAGGKLKSPLIERLPAASFDKTR